jgi:hypothetical protein
MTSSGFPWPFLTTRQTPKTPQILPILAASTSVAPDNVARRLLSYLHSIERHFVVRAGRAVSARNGLRPSRDWSKQFFCEVPDVR